MAGRVRNYDREVRLQKPDGSFVWVPEDEVAGFYKQGYKIADPESTVFVDSWNGERESVKAGDLPHKFEQGYTMGNAKEEIQKEVSKEIDAADYLTPIEKLGAFTTGLDPTAGLAGGMINKGVDYALGKDPNETNTKLRELSSAAGGYHTAGTIAGLIPTAMATGGLTAAASKGLGAAAGAGALASGLTTSLSTAGKISTAARVGSYGVLGGLEGTGYSLMHDAGEATLGNPDINAERLIADAKTGFLWGSLSNLAFTGIGKAVDPITKRLARTDTHVAIDDLPEIKLENVSGASPSGVNVFSIKDSVTNAPVGLVRIDLKNPNSIHPIGRTGVSVNDLSLDDAFKGKRYEEAVVGELIKNYGRVASHSEGAALSGEMEKVFSSLGSSHVNEAGDVYFTAHRTPVTRITNADKLVEMYGKYRVKGIEDVDKKELFERFADRGNKDFRDKVIQFYNDPYKVIVDTSKNIDNMAKVGKKIRSHSEKLKARMSSKLVPANINKMQSRVTDILQEAGEVQARIAENPFLYNRQVIALHDNVVESVKAAMKEAKPSDGIEIIRKTVKKLNANIDRYKKATSGISADDLNLLGKLSSDLNEGFLKNAKVTGRFGRAFNELQEAHSKLVEQTKLFNARYMDKNGIVNKEKVVGQLKGKFEVRSKEASLADALYVEALNNYVDVARKLSKRTRLSTKEIDNQAKGLWTNVDSLKEIHDSSRLINDMVNSSSTGLVSGMLEGGSSAAGAALSQAAGINWFVGAITGQHIGRKISRTIQNPIYMIDKIEKIGNATSNTTNRVSELSTKFINKAKDFKVNQMNLAKIVPAIVSDHKDYKKMRDQLVTKLDTLSPAVLEDDLADLAMNAPNHAKAIINKKLEVSQYIRDNLPPPQREYKDTRKDTKRLKMLVEAAFDPMAGIERFLITGDRSSFDHVEKMYPKLVEDVRNRMVRDLPKAKLDAVQKARMNSLFKKGNEIIHKALSDVQNVYREEREEAKGKKQGGKGGSSSKLKPEDFQTNFERIASR